MKKFDAVGTWIASVAQGHSKSKNTAKNYRRELKIFCDFIGKTPEQILEEYDGMSDRQFRRKYALYLRGLIAKMANEKFTSGTINCMIIAIRSFFKYSDLPLGYVPTSRYRVVFHNRDLQHKEVTQILAISGPRDRAFFCMMAQSGLRPGILTKLRYEHIQEDFENETVPMKIFVPSEIAKGAYGSFFTFAGEETTKYLTAYLMKRPQIKPSDYLFTSHGTEKKLNAKSVSEIFARLVRRLESKAIMEVKERQKGKPAEIRLYNLRKFFRKEAGKAGVEYVNFWMGHKTNYRAPYIPASDVHYFSREDVDFQRRLYREKAMPFLRLETATPSETEQTIMELRKELDRVSNENRDLRGKLEEFGLVETKVSQLDRDVKELKASSKRGGVGPASILGVLLTTTALDAKGTSKALQELVRKKAKALLQQIQKERGYRTEEEAVQALLKELTNGMLIK